MPMSENLKGLLAKANGLDPEAIEYGDDEGGYLGRQLLSCLVSIVSEQQEQIERLEAALRSR